jgi:hypothetical protein
MRRLQIDDAIEPILGQRSYVVYRELIPSALSVDVDGLPALHLVGTHRVKPSSTGVSLLHLLP